MMLLDVALLAMEAMIESDGRLAVETGTEVDEESTSEEVIATEVVAGSTEELKLEIEVLLVVAFDPTYRAPQTWVLYCPS